MAQSSTPVVTDTTILEIAERLYNRRPHVERLSGGVNMHVYALGFGDPAQDRVIKVAGTDRWQPWAVLDEIAAMRALRGQGIHEVPEIEKTHEDLGWTTLPFLVTRHIRPGIMIENELRPDAPDAERIWRKAGALRARLGQVDWQCTTRTLTPRQAAEQIVRFVGYGRQTLAEMPDYVGVFDGLFDAVVELASAEGHHFGQGDSSEILTDGDDGLALVDFSGFVGAHRRLRELGLINGRVRFRYGGDPRVPTWHEEGFFAGEAVTPEMRQELTIWEIYSLVADAGWLTNLGRVDECRRQLEFAQARLEQAKPM